MPTGKLYQSNNDELIGGVNYQFQHESENRWWGELTLIDYVRIKDGPGYVLEREDGLRSRCSLSHGLFFPASVEKLPGQVHSHCCQTQAVA